MLTLQQKVDRECECQQCEDGKREKRGNVTDPKTLLDRCHLGAQFLKWRVELPNANGQTLIQPLDKVLLQVAHDLGGVGGLGHLHS
jgi:hypothetical protein